MQMDQNQADGQLVEELLLHSVIDGEFRSELSSVDFSTLPSPVLPQDMSFAEIVRNINNAACVNTCISGLTVKCEQQGTFCSGTCSTGYTIRCDRMTNS